MKVSGWFVSVALLGVVSIVDAAGPGDLAVYGEIESKTGFRYPDGSLQITAAGDAVLAQEVQVAKSGGRFASIQAAIDSVTDASDAKRYVIRVAPGIYSEKVTMKQFISIHGAGSNLTVISSEGASPVVTASNDAFLRDVTVRCTSFGQDCTGILDYRTSYFALRDVEILVSAYTIGTPTGEARALKIFGGGGHTIRNSSIVAWGGEINVGIDCTSVRFEMTNVEVSAGIMNVGSGSNTAIGCGSSC